MSSLGSAQLAGSTKEGRDMKNTSTKNTIKPHTEAKLKFYISYLSRYLNILVTSKDINKIMIYDMFCGMGVYDDGKKGSAIRAVDTVFQVNKDPDNATEVYLHFNDINSDKIKKLKQQISAPALAANNIKVTYSSIEASSLISKLPVGFSTQSRHTRNLVFIDPYGYKAINREDLAKIITAGRSEIILFLPIEQMNRFKDKAIGDVVDPSFKALHDFIEKFKLDITSIETEKELVKAIERSMRFTAESYSTSYLIKNLNGHYYALFFATGNIKGLEKIVEVKWSLDKDSGSEFSGSAQHDALLQLEKFDELEFLLENQLEKGDKTNAQLYELVLTHGFLPKHANTIFKKWQNIGRLQVVDGNTEEPVRRGTFKLNYRSWKSPQEILNFKLEQVPEEA